MEHGAIVEVQVIAFPITMVERFLQLIMIMIKTVLRTVHGVPREHGGIKAVTCLISMDLTTAQGSQLRLVLELVGEVLMDFMIL